MPDPARFRDSTQIVVPCRNLDGIRDDIEEKFVVTIYETDEQCRIIASPIVIKELTNYLARHGISLA